MCCGDKRYSDGRDMIHRSRKDKGEEMDTGLEERRIIRLAVSLQDDNCFCTCIRR